MPRGPNIVTEVHFYIPFENFVSKCLVKFITKLFASILDFNLITKHLYYTTVTCISNVFLVNTKKTTKGLALIFYSLIIYFKLLKTNPNVHLTIYKF